MAGRANIRRRPLAWRRQNDAAPPDVPSAATVVGLEAR
jgi:hypothetical protein